MPAQFLPFLLIMIALRSGKLKWIDCVILLVVAIQAIMHVRHVALLSLTTLVLLPRPLSESLVLFFPGLTQRWTGPQSLRIRLAGVIAVCVLLISLHLPASIALWREGVPPWRIAVESGRRAPGVPVRAMAVLESEGLKGNLITSYGWAQHAIWELHPACRIAFDGRYRTVFPRQLEEDFLAFQQLDSDGPYLTPMLDRYETNIALLPANTGPCRYLHTRKDWTLIYRDTQAALFVRNLPQFQPVIERAASKLLSVPPRKNWSTFPDPVHIRSAVAIPRVTIGR